MEIVDILIVGAGPAGLTAAIYAQRAGKKTIVFDKIFYGGQVAITPAIENYPAIPLISGPDFSQQLYEQATGFGAEVRFEEVESLGLMGPIKTVTTSQNVYYGRAVILANGVKRRLLGCPGEEEFTGRGVSYCATCDGAFFKGKDVVLVGGGNTALEDALFLSDNCRKVTVVHRRNTFRGEKHLAHAVESRSNIEISWNTTVEEIMGNERVSAVRLKNHVSHEEKQLETEGVFVAIGYIPDNGLAAGQLKLDKAGYIVADESCTTGIEGVFVAGDSRVKPLRQIITAASDGAVAAFQAANYLNTHEDL